MAKDRVDYRHVKVDGTIVTYVPHPHVGGMTVVGGQDRLSGKPIASGSAFRYLGRDGKKRTTALEAGGRFWTVRGWLTDVEAAKAIHRALHS